MTRIEESDQSAGVVVSFRQADNCTKLFASCEQYPQLFAELMAISKSQIPASIGASLKLLWFAIDTGNDKLVMNLLNEGVKPDFNTIVRISKTMKISGVTIQSVLVYYPINKQNLPALLRGNILRYTLPLITGRFTEEEIKFSCPFNQIKSLYEATGFVFSERQYLYYVFSGTMTGAQLEDIKFVASQVARPFPKHFDEMVRGSKWYWAVFASDEEKQAILDKAPNLAPFIRSWFEHAEPTQGLWWDAKQLDELPDLPLQLAQRVIWYSCGTKESASEYRYAPERIKALRERVRDVDWGDDRVCPIRDALYD